MSEELLAEAIKTQASEIENLKKDTTEELGELNTATDSEAKEFLNEIIRKGQKQLEKKLVLVDTNNSKNVDDV